MKKGSSARIRRVVLPAWVFAPFRPGSVGWHLQQQGGIVNLTVNIIACARCHGSHPGGVSFKPLTHPIVGDAGDFTHWALCPTNGEPILLRVDEEKKLLVR